MNIFLDTNVLLDMFLDRDDGASYKIFQKTAMNVSCQVYVSDITVINTHYIISKFSTKENALGAVKLLRRNCTLVSVEENIIDNAIQCSFPDFEDAIQYFCAEKVNSNYLITRNTKDFEQSRIVVKTSEEWLIENQ